MFPYKVVTLYYKIKKKGLITHHPLVYAPSLKGEAILKNIEFQLILQYIIITEVFNINKLCID